jgi:hypothetical protein
MNGGSILVDSKAMCQPIHVNWLYNLVTTRCSMHQLRIILMNLSDVNV